MKLTGKAKEKFDKWMRPEPLEHGRFGQLVTNTMNNKRYNQEGEEVDAPSRKYKGGGNSVGSSNQFTKEYANWIDNTKTIKQWIELAEERGSQLKAKDKEIEDLNAKLTEQVEETRLRINQTIQLSKEIEELKETLQSAVDNWQLEEDRVEQSNKGAKHWEDAYIDLQNEVERLKDENKEARSILSGVLEEYHINPFHAEQIKELLK